MQEYAIQETILHLSAVLNFAVINFTNCDTNIFFIHFILTAYHKIEE